MHGKNVYFTVTRGGCFLGDEDEEARIADKGLQPVNLLPRRDVIIKDQRDIVGLPFWGRFCRGRGCTKGDHHRGSLAGVTGGGLHWFTGPRASLASGTFLRWFTAARIFLTTYDCFFGFFFAGGVSLGGFDDSSSNGSLSDGV